MNQIVDQFKVEGYQVTVLEDEDGDYSWIVVTPEGDKYESDWFERNESAKAAANRAVSNLMAGRNPYVRDDES